VLSTGLVGLLHELFKGEVVENLVGGLREFLVEEPDGDFPGRHFGRDAAFAEGEAAFEASHNVPHNDLARGAGEAVTAFAADFAVEEAATAESEKYGFEELGREAFVFGQVAGLDVGARTHPRQLHDSAKTVFRLLGKPQEPLLDAGEIGTSGRMVWEEAGCSKLWGKWSVGKGMTNDEIRMTNEIRPLKFE